MPAEEIGHAVGELRAAGALEVWTHAVQMKKDRPGVVLSALARAEARAALERVLFDSTSTFGVRWREVERTECRRRAVEVTLDGIAVRVKVRERPARPVEECDLFPEHDDLARAARELARPLAELRRRAIREAARLV